MNSDQGRSAKPAWITLLILFVGIPVMAVIATLLWYMSRQWQARTKLEREVADLRASGLPTDNASLAEYYASLTEKRGTSKWLRIFEQLESQRFREASLNMPYVGDGQSRGVPLPSEPWAEQAEVEAFLESQKSLLDELHQAAGEPEPVWFPIEFNSFRTLLPHPQTARTAARLLHLEHDVAVHAGDGARAARSIRSLLGLTESLRGEPFIVSQLVRVWIHGIAINALQRSVEQNSLDEEDLTDLLERLSAFDDFRTPYRVAITGERAAALPVFENPAIAGAEVPSTVVGSRPRDALAALRLYERMEQVAEQEDLDAFVQASSRLSAQIDAEFDAASMLEKYETQLTRLLLPASESFARAFARQAMQNRLAQLATAVRLYRHRFGEWPEQLDEVRAVGIDPAVLVPLGGKPFGYRVDAGAAILWGFNPTVPSADGTVLSAVPDGPPPLDDPNQLANDSWVWRLVP